VAPTGHNFSGTITAVSEGGRESGKYGRFLDHPSFDVALAALGATQHAVVQLGQLRDLGLTGAAVHKRAAAGRLHRIYRGVYSLVPRELLTREGHWLAAVFACGPEAVLSHRTAAALHELRPNARALIEVTVPGRSAREHERIQVHRSTTLTAKDVTKAKNIPCTTVARTLLDLADVISARGMERVFDQAEMIEVFDLRALEDQLARNTTRGASQRVRAVLEEHYPGTTPTESQVEEAFLAMTRAADLPDPELQAWLALPDGGPPIRVDFLWRAQRLAVETDGRRTHGTRQAQERDTDRDQRLTLAGWRPIRVTWKQSTREAEQTGARIKALLAM
jgi:predicted transcriptional regulator of viral defense system